MDETRASSDTPMSPGGLIDAHLAAHANQLGNHEDRISKLEAAAQPDDSAAADVPDLPAHELSTLTGGPGGVSANAATPARVESRTPRVVLPKTRAEIGRELLGRRR